MSMLYKIIGGDYVHIVKFIGGIMSTLQNSWGDYVHVYKFEQGGFCSGGYCPTFFPENKGFN